MTTRGEFPRVHAGTPAYPFARSSDRGGYNRGIPRPVQSGYKRGASGSSGLLGQSTFASYELDRGGHEVLAGFTWIFRVTFGDGPLLDGRPDDVRVLSARPFELLGRQTDELRRWQLPVVPPVVEHPGRLRVSIPSKAAETTRMSTSLSES